MATDNIDLSHFFKVQKVRLNNLSRNIDKTSEKIEKIFAEHEAKVKESKKTTMIPAEKIIELSELRIGNILSYKGHYVHVTLISIDADDEYEDTIGFCPMGTASGEKTGWNRALADGLDRIPLTPEILEKCGFEQVEVVNSDGDEDTGWRHWIDHDLRWISGRINYDYSDLSHVLCLHQLQNLFYCLTGQELEVKL